METQQINMDLRKIIKKIIREQKEEEMNAAPTHPIKGEKPTNPDEPTSRKILHMQTLMRVKNQDIIPHKGAMMKML